MADYTTTSVNSAPAPMAQTPASMAQMYQMRGMMNPAMATAMGISPSYNGGGMNGGISNDAMMMYNTGMYNSGLSGDDALTDGDGNALVSKGMASQGLFNFLTASILMVGIIGQVIMAQKATRRKRNVGLSGVFDSESSVFYKVLGDLDQEDCIATAVCHASSFDVINRERNEKLLRAMGISKDVPVPWTNLVDVTSKYQYAAFVGHTLNTETVEKGCSAAFPSCVLPAQDVLRLLTNEVTSCVAMMDSLERLWPQEFEGGHEGHGVSGGVGGSERSGKSVKSDAVKEGHGVSGGVGGVSGKSEAVKEGKEGKSLKESSGGVSGGVEEGIVVKEGDGENISVNVTVDGVTNATKIDMNEESENLEKNVEEKTEKTEKESMAKGETESEQEIKIETAKKSQRKSESKSESESESEKVREEVRESVSNEPRKRHVRFR